MENADTPFEIIEPRSGLVRRRTVTARTRELLFGRSGGRCNFPDCRERQWDDAGVPLLEIVHINSISGRGPRGDQNLTLAQLSGIDNLLLLCPYHHRLVDRRPDEYTAEYLREIRDRHVDRIGQGIDPTLGASGQNSSTLAKSPLAKALDVWKENSSNSNERFWQKLFTDVPACLIATLGGRAYALESECFVGGKSWGNRGGNVVDFLAIFTSNVAFIEIKTPMTKLVGGRYRENVYPPHRELAGAVVQVLESRRTMLQELAHLNANSPRVKDVVAASPVCFVIAGNLEHEQLDVAQRRSFELYRSSLRDVHIVTFDEVFSAVEVLLEASLRDENDDSAR